MLLATGALIFVGVVPGAFKCPYSLEYVKLCSQNTGEIRA